MTRRLLLALAVCAPAALCQSPGYDLYLLIGQSNMAGRGKVEAQDRKPHPRVFALGKDDQWIPATDPLHFDKPIAGVGLGLTFGKVMAEADPGARIGLIPGAYGGTSVTAWQKDADPHPQFGPMYAETIRRARLAMKDGVLRGILWHQGESDMKRAGGYEALLIRFVSDLRADLDAEEIPFVVGLLGLWREEDPKQAEGAKAINAILRNIPGKVERCAVVDSAGLTNKPDDLGHFNAASYRELGRRYAAALQSLQAR